ncbi:uncharacterized protein LOC131328594 [Rhododendron vialii]|uniref:uncharacterized protein LOC131328594 n=1 Tax=Rhododendron vialii TaxID=182163 RepID=UPI00265D6191|nr:uncharacterized protein LOC131328594 [Rhododendron vialii]
MEPMFIYGMCLCNSGDISATQTGASTGKTPSSVRSKAIWDKDARECFILICVEELGGANYKSGTQLTKLWKNLVLGESGLGKDPDTGAITASDEWWELKLMRHPDCYKFKLKPLTLEEEMRILFGSNTKQVAVDGFATKKGKGKKGTVTSRLEACMQQICDSTDSASSPSVQRVAAEIPTMKECANKLSELREFNEDAELWAQGFNLFKNSKIRAIFMSCPDDLRMYHFITQELNRAQTAELAKT